MNKVKEFNDRGYNFIDISEKVVCNICGLNTYKIILTPEGRRENYCQGCSVIFINKL